MKTKRTLRWLVVLIGLLLGRDALAFYNPQTGRWLSRDPVEERGANNLYSFIANAPLSKIDTDGRFTGSKCAVCGQWYQGYHKCPPPPPAVNPCDGYKQFIPTPKCMCNCKYIEDPYPANAERVCNGFMRNTNGARKLSVWLVAWLGLSRPHMA